MMTSMTQQISILVDEALIAKIQDASGGDVSTWMADAARNELTRQTWVAYNDTAEALGVNEPSWMDMMVADRERAR